MTALKYWDPGTSSYRTLTGAQGPVGPTGPTGAVGPTGPMSVVANIGDTAPASPVNGTLWWCSADGNLYIYYNDGTSSQWVQINTVGT